MKRFRPFITLTAALLFSGCYHAIVNTGATPNGQSIKVAWAHSFLAGLVPPKVVDAMQKCPGGVARVETVHSFLNLVAETVTFGIYSPLTIEVQCAGRSGSLDRAARTFAVNKTATAEERLQAVNHAVAAAQAAGQAVYLIFD